MENALRYQVRSREIVDLVAAMRNGRLIISPYFQRNLVWRDVHRRDFIDTILRGFPFPQIFLARGPINVETMESYTCVVDGQQRLNAIRGFVSDEFAVSGRRFSELRPKEKEEFLKYEVPIIDFDLDAGDPNLKEIFKRLNRTYYALTTIEKIATEFSASQFLLVARLLAGEIVSNPSALEIEMDEDFATDDEDMGANKFLHDPGIEAESWAWLVERAGGSFARLVLERGIFSNYEAERKVPLMFTLNILGTLLGGYYNRNSRVKEYLERYNDEFPESDILISHLNVIADYVGELRIPAQSMWWNKANFFTLVIELEAANPRFPEASALSAQLTAFEKKTPPDYALAAREAVNNKNQRALRGTHVKGMIKASSAQGVAGG